MRGHIFASTKAFQLASGATVFLITCLCIYGCIYAFFLTPFKVAKSLHMTINVSARLKPQLNKHYHFNTPIYEVIEVYCFWFVFVPCTHKKRTLPSTYDHQAKCVDCP